MRLSKYSSQVMITGLCERNKGAVKSAKTQHLCKGQGTFFTAALLYLNSFLIAEGETNSQLQSGPFLQTFDSVNSFTSL